MRTCVIIHPLHLELETALQFTALDDEPWFCEWHLPIGKLQETVDAHAARHAKRTKTEIFFWDESGFRADAVPGQRQGISAASAISANGASWFATYAGALTRPLFVNLLRRMMRGRRKPLDRIFILSFQLVTSP